MELFPAPPGPEGRYTETGPVKCLVVTTPTAGQAEERLVRERLWVARGIWHTPSLSMAERAPLRERASLLVVLL